MAPIRVVGHPDDPALDRAASPRIRHPDVYRREAGAGWRLELVGRWHARAGRQGHRAIAGQEVTADNRQPWLPAEGRPHRRVAWVAAGAGEEMERGALEEITVQYIHVGELPGRPRGAELDHPDRLVALTAREAEGMRVYIRTVLQGALEAGDWIVKEQVAADVEAAGLRRHIAVIALEGIGYHFHHGEGDADQGKHGQNEAGAGRTMQGVGGHRADGGGEPAR